MKETQKGKKSLPKSKKTNVSENLKKENLQSAIKNRGIKRKELADMLHVSDRQIGHYINGTTRIPHDALLQLSEILQVSTDYIEGKTKHPEGGLAALQKDITEYNLTLYKPVMNMIESAGIQFEYKNDCLYMNPVESEPIPMDNNLYWFFIKHIREYVKNLFTDYYNSVYAFEYRYKNLKDEPSAQEIESNPNNLNTKKEGDAND